MNLDDRRFKDIVEQHTGCREELAKDPTLERLGAETRRRAFIETSQRIFTLREMEQDLMFEYEQYEKTQDRIVEKLREIRTMQRLEEENRQAYLNKLLRPLPSISKGSESA